MRKLAGPWRAGTAPGFRSHPRSKPGNDRLHRGVKCLKQAENGCNAATARRLGYGRRPNVEPAVRTPVRGAVVRLSAGIMEDHETRRGQPGMFVHGLAPDAPGWLGSTAGVTDNGKFVRFARVRARRGGPTQQRPRRAGPMVDRNLDAFQQRAHVCEQHRGRR